MQCNCCGNTDCSTFYTENRGTNVALICGKCGRWQKWVGKKDLRGIYAMGVKREPIEQMQYAGTLFESGTAGSTLPIEAPKRKKRYQDMFEVINGAQGVSGASMPQEKPKATAVITECPQCGGHEFVRRPTSIHMGLYCGTCGKWIKWVKK